MPALSPAIVSERAPTGKLRVAINFGNMVLAQKDVGTGDLRGATAELRASSGGGSTCRSS